MWAQGQGPELVSECWSWYHTNCKHILLEASGRSVRGGRLKIITHNWQSLHRYQAWHKTTSPGTGGGAQRHSAGLALGEARFPSPWHTETNKKQSYSLAGEMDGSVSKVLAHTCRRAKHRGLQSHHQEGIPRAPRSSSTLSPEGRGTLGVQVLSKANKQTSALEGIPKNNIRHCLWPHAWAHTIAPSAERGWDTCPYTVTSVKGNVSKLTRILPDGKGLVFSLRSEDMDIDVCKDIKSYQRWGVALWQSTWRACVRPCINLQRCKNN